MIEVTVGQDKKIQVEKKEEVVLLNGSPSKYEIIKISNQSYGVYGNQKIFTVNVVLVNKKEMILNVNNQEVEVKATDHMDQILEKLGMNITQSDMLKEVKAPMPGTVLNVLVKEGGEVQSGSQLLILEAMKMENVIKASGDGVVSKIHISEKENVEKNQVLISFR